LRILSVNHNEPRGGRQFIREWTMQQVGVRKLWFLAGRGAQKGGRREYLIEGKFMETRENIGKEPGWV